MISSMNERSGSSRRFQALARELALLGHSVLYLERGSPRRTEESPGLTLRFTREARWLPATVLHATAFNSAAALFAQADVVYALKPLPNASIPALLKGLFAPRAKLVLDVDDLDFGYYPDGLMSRVTRGFFRLFPPLFHLVTTHNEILRDLLVRSGIDEARILHVAQGFDPALFREPGPQLEMWRSLGLEGFEVVVYAASLGMTSDLDVILPALIEIASAKREVKVLVLGEGEKVNGAKERVAAAGLGPRFVFPGYVEHRLVPGLLRLSRVALNYLEPTLTNRCRASLKLREYLAAGLPVVTNLLGGDRVFGPYVEEVSSTEEIPAAISSLLADPRADRVSRGKGFVMERFAWPVVARSLEAGLRELVGSGPQ